MNSEKKLLKKIINARFIKRKPLILSHLITNRCNANCPGCLWKNNTKSTENELDTGTIINLYQQAKDYGLMAVVIWGGEPLIRNDIDVVLSSAKRIGLLTSIITNGFYLPEKHSKIAPFLDLLLVSIVIPSPKNDDFFAIPGIFEKATKGIELIKRANPNCKINIISLVNKLNRGYIKEIVQFSDNMNIPVTFQAMNTIDYGSTLTERDFSELCLNENEEIKTFEMIKKFKKQGFQITNSIRYLDSFISQNKIYKCHYKKIVVRVEPDGKILDCTKNGDILLDIKREPLSKLLKSREFKAFQKRAENCHICVDAGAMESSFLWELQKEPLNNAYRMLL